MPMEESIAGFWRRVAALFYDGILLVGMLILATVPVLLLTGGQVVAPGNLAYQFYLFAVSCTFFCVFWIRGGQTPGMRAWRLRVVADNGERIDGRRAIVRFVGSIVSLLAFGLGFFWILIDREHRAWHDRASRTRVVLTPVPAASRRSADTADTADSNQTHD